MSHSFPEQRHAEGLSSGKQGMQSSRSELFDSSPCSSSGTVLPPLCSLLKELTFNTTLGQISIHLARSLPQGRKVKTQEADFRDVLTAGVAAPVLGAGLHPLGRQRLLLLPPPVMSPDASRPLSLPGDHLCSPPFTS